jgi:septum formation protein
MAATLILASTSRYRAELLSRLRLGFQSVAPGVEETAVAGEPPAGRALRLARAKALAVAERFPGSWVVGSDQVADLAGRILDKPGDAVRCREQLAAESGRIVEFHTAAVLLRHGPHRAFEHVDRTIARFRPLAPDTIDRYVTLDRPFDCAGGFRSEGLGALLLESVETRDPTALVGLPLLWLAGALREAGIDPLTGQD